MRILKPLFTVFVLAAAIFAVYYYFIWPHLESTAKIVHLTDPDSIMVMEDGELKKVQLIGLDAPELTGPYFSMQCYESEAKKEAVKFFNKERELRLSGDNKLGDKDIYDRDLRYVSLKSGESYNEFLLKEGLAKEYHPEEKEYEKMQQYKKLEEEAKEKKIGIWDACNGEF
jgi:micrococcal nuclease